MKYALLAVVTIAIIAQSGCATKQYPMAPAISAEESSVLDCQAVKQEIAKTHSMQEEIDRTGSFDGRTVLGFMGDFGVGNGMAKSSAYQKSQDRLTQLEALKASKCH